MLWLSTALWGQIVLSNWGEEIRVLPSTVVSVEGGVGNFTGGTWYHSGQLHLTDTLHNSAGNVMFLATFPNGTPVSPGSVLLRGGWQWITGSSFIEADSVFLSGNSSKNLAQDFYIRRFLDLENHAFHTHAETLFILSDDLDAVDRQSGWVKSSQGGALWRRGQTGNRYLFPLGDSVPSASYRPVFMTPSQPGGYAARLANYDASLEGYPRTAKEDTFCLLNPEYFHHLSGPAPAQVEISVTPPYEAIAQWTTLWQNRGGTSTGSFVVGTLPLGNTPTPHILGVYKPSVSLYPPQSFYCTREPVTLTVPSPNPNWIYVWYYVSLSGQTDSVATGTQYTTPAGQYGFYYVEVRIPGTQECKETSSLMVGVFPPPIADFSIVPPDSQWPGIAITLTDQSTGGMAYQWLVIYQDTQRYAGAPSISLTFRASGPYTLGLITQSPEGCLDTIYKPYFIRFEPGLYIPTGFTPNGDGNNDEFVIYGPPLSSFLLQIYNRWGEKIWETRSLTPYWKGQNMRGHQVPEGVYVYRLEAQTLSGKTYQRTGSITLLR
ncbi:MAG: T9SS type B sorting domain-containing protein [Bacteroidia bacterium]